MKESSRRGNQKTAKTEGGGTREKLQKPRMLSEKDFLHWLGPGKKKKGKKSKKVNITVLSKGDRGFNSQSFVQTWDMRNGTRGAWGGD